MKKLFDAIKLSHDTFPQRPDADETAKRRLLDPAFAPPNVYRYYDRYQARVSIGGIQHTLGVGSIHACIRMADAALLFFWGYRQRPMRGPIDTDFILGIDIARYDLDNCAVIATHLDEVERLLLNAGILRAVDKKDVMEGFKFNRARFLLKWYAFQSEHQLMLEELRRNGETARHLHATASESFDAYSKCVDTADRAILKPKTFAPPPRDASIDQAL